MNVASEKQQILPSAEIALLVLQVLSQPHSIEKRLRRLVGVLRAECQLDAVGLRLPRGADYPYYVQKGLSSAFLQREDSLLCEMSEDSDGSSPLACVCGGVLQGTITSEASFLSPNGSFWTNSLTELLASEEADLLPPHCRETCVEHGFESMLLVPLKGRENHIGLLQLVDRSKGRFQAETVTFFENLAQTVGSVCIQLDQTEQAKSSISVLETELEQREAKLDGLARELSEKDNLLGDALESLRQSEQFYRSIFESTEIGLVVRDTNETLVQVNEAFERFLNYDVGSLVGKKMVDVLFQDSLATTRQLMTEMLEGKRQQIVVEKRYIRRDGVLVWGRTNTSLVRDVEGHPQFWVCKVQDITQEKLTLAALHNAEAQLRQRTEELRLSQELAGLAGWEIEQGCLQLSREMLTQKGLSLKKADLEMDEYLLSAHPDDVEKILKGLVEVASGEPYREYLFRSHPDNGDIRYFRSMVGRLEGDEAQKYKIIGVTQDISDLWQAREMIQESEEQFRKAFDLAPHGMALVDLNGKFMEVNKALCGLLGYSEEELQSRTFADVTFGEDLGKGFEVLRAMVAGEVDQCHFEKRYVAKSGEVIWCHLSSGVVRDSSGAARHLVSQIYSIQTQREAALVLHEKEERYRQMFHRTQAVALLIDPETGQIVDANDAALKFYGYSQEQMAELRIWNLNIWPESRVRTEMKKVRDADGRLDEFRHQLATGEIRDVEVHSGPIDVGGQTLLYSIIFDVTERKVAERALREKTMEYRQLSQEFAALLNAIDDPIYLIGPEYDVMWANQAARSYWGDPAPQPGEKCYRLWGDQEEICSYCLCPEIFEQGQPLEKVLPPHEAGIWQWSGYPVKNDQGKVEKVIVLARDITDQIELREKATRSQQLAALGELAAGVAHEINNPTGLIMLNIDRLMEATPDLLARLDRVWQKEGDFQLGPLKYSRMRTILPTLQEDIFKGSRRISQIIGELKNLTREDEFDPAQPVDLNEVVNSSLSVVEGLLLGATLTVEVELSEPLPFVQGVFLKLEQVLCNLLVNAAQSLENYEQSISIWTGQDEDGHVLVRITDEGVGMTPEVLRQVTRPFYTTRRENGGTGLGLAICDRIVREHKGQLNFHSTPGQGTSVTLLLPPLQEELS